MKQPIFYFTLVTFPKHYSFQITTKHLLWLCTFNPNPKKDEDKVLRHPNTNANANTDIIRATLKFLDFK